MTNKYAWDILCTQNQFLTILKKTHQLVMKSRILLFLAILSTLISSCATLQDSGRSRLDRIKARGELICGISGKIPGFSFLTTEGNYEGIDIDICKAFAASIIGNSQSIQYRPLTAAERFTALRTEEVDLLSRNTTFNLTRDSIGGNGVIFAPVVFYDGQGILVQADSKINSINDLNGTTICVGSGTTTEQNLNDIFESNKISYTPIKYQDINQVVAGYLKGRC